VHDELFGRDLLGTHVRLGQLHGAVRQRHVPGALLVRRHGLHLRQRLCPLPLQRKPVRQHLRAGVQRSELVVQLKT
jgi:hypothetical protein